MHASKLKSIGSSAARKEFRGALVDYLGQYKTQLDDDSQRRLETNPLRILDSKDPETRKLLVDAPRLENYLDEESRRTLPALKNCWIRLALSTRLTRLLSVGSTITAKPFSSGSPTASAPKELSVQAVDMMAW